MVESVEVDQSGKIEDTATDTVLGFSDDISHSVLIPTKVKRQCLLELRRRGKTGKSLYWLMFATGLFFLLKDHIQQFSRVTIDVEYEGHSARIKEHLINLLRRNSILVSGDQIIFRRIGRKSPAHDIAYNVHGAKVMPDRKIRLVEFLAEFNGTKKIGDPLRGSA